MTRYSNPLPPNQVPNTQGRPAGAQPHPAAGFHQGQGAQAWPNPNAPAAPRGQSGGFGDTSGYGFDQQGAGSTQHPDLYAALKPDGYGYTQPPQAPVDPYGLAGYTSPQPAPQPQAYSQRSQPTAPSVHAPYPGGQDSFGYSSGFAQGNPAAGPAAHGLGSNGFGDTQSAFGAHASPAAPQHTQPQHSPLQPTSSPYGAAPLSPSPLAPSPLASSQVSPRPMAPLHAHAEPQSYGGYGNGQGAASFARADAPFNGGGDQWGAAGSLSADARDYGHDANGYAQQSQWGGDAYGDPQSDPSYGAQQQYGQNPQLAQGNSFDQSYAEDDVQYEDEPRRGGWKKIVALVACTVVVGGALTIAYSSIMSPDTGETPLVKGASGPSKVKPSDPGGKQFAHADSKIMGRLGEGGADAPDSGVRKVPVVSVGRDGSIQPPATAAPDAAPQDQTRAVVAVPGLTVIDGLGPSPSRPQQGAPAVQMMGTANSAPQKPVVVDPPKKQAEKSPNLIANADASNAAGAMPTKAVVVPAKADPAPAPPKKERVATATPVNAAPQATGAAGYVAVLASVPASGSSRMDALKQFADMQQKYGGILSNKTPDIREANLGEKGTYHRLLVGPPGSRDSANSVCSQLKAEGYSGCWVTAY